MELTLLVGIGESEVDQFESAVKVDKQIFWLEVAMDDAKFMQILYSCDELSKEFTGLMLFESFLFDNEFEELSLRNVLHD